MTKGDVVNKTLICKSHQGIQKLHAGNKDYIGNNFF